MQMRQLAQGHIASTTSVWNISIIMGGILIFSQILFSSEATEIFLHVVSTYFDLYWIQWFGGDGDDWEVTRGNFNLCKDLYLTL